MEVSKVNDEPPAGSLFWKLWNSCTDIAQDVLATGYFNGIQRGNLNPVAFGQLMVQDAYYCMKGRDDYSAAATHAADDVCRDFCMKKVQSYDDYNQYYHETWHIREAESVIPGDEIKSYADYEAHVAGNLETPYLFCVMLPCEYLWTWVANNLKDKTPEDSLYYFWIKSNEGIPEGAYQMGNLLEAYRSQISEDKAMEIYRKAMNYELAVFNAATELTTITNLKK
ncbi:MAG: hypothetical protein LBL94_05555 [Prevotellaceae bacterium]|nr:hypothetical protein [Prevotellaceae bacterium]